MVQARPGEPGASPAPPGPSPRPRCGEGLLRRLLLHQVSSGYIDIDTTFYQLCNNNICSKFLTDNATTKLLKRFFAKYEFFKK